MSQLLTYGIIHGYSIGPLLRKNLSFCLTFLTAAEFPLWHLEMRLVSLMTILPETIFPEGVDEAAHASDITFSRR